MRSLALSLCLCGLASLRTPNKEIEVLFAPTGEERVLEARIGAEIARARKGVRVAMFHFTSRRLVGSLAARARAGVPVRVLLDGRVCDPSFVKELRRAGLDVRRAFPGKHERTRFHHKFCVLDDRIVVTGSYNWTVMGDVANHENVVILRDRNAARTFAQTFDAAWENDSLSRP